MNHSVQSPWFTSATVISYKTSSDTTSIPQICIIKNLYYIKIVYIFLNMFVFPIKKSKERKTEDIERNLNSVREVLSKTHPRWLRLENKKKIYKKLFFAKSFHG